MGKINLKESRSKDISWELSDDGTITATSETIPEWSFHIHRPVQWASHQPGENPRYYATLQELVNDVEDKHAEAQGGVERDVDEILAVLGDDED